MFVLYCLTEYRSTKLSDEYCIVRWPCGTDTVSFQLLLVIRRRRWCIRVDGVSCAVLVDVSVVVRLCLLLMVAVTGYCLGDTSLILIRTVETKTTVHKQLVVVRAF